MTEGSMTKALKQLLPISGGEIEMQSLIALFVSNSDLISIATSWLNSGCNLQITSSQINSVLGQRKIRQFAGQLDIGAQDAAAGLANIIPGFIDQNSEKGEIKPDALAGIANSALKLFA